MQKEGAQQLFSEQPRQLARSVDGWLMAGVKGGQHFQVSMQEALHCQSLCQPPPSPPTGSCPHSLPPSSSISAFSDGPLSPSTSPSPAGVVAPFALLAPASPPRRLLTLAGPLPPFFPPSLSSTCSSPSPPLSPQTLPALAALCRVHSTACLASGAGTWAWCCGDLHRWGAVRRQGRSKGRGSNYWLIA